MRVTTLYITLLVSVLLAACGRRPAEPPRADSTSVSPEPDSPASAGGVILFLGNSLSAGYGVDPDSAFPNLIDARIDSLGWDFDVVNAGVSGETSSDGVRRIDWLLRRRVDFLVLELGGNDGLRGIPTDVTRKNLQSIIDRTRSRYPEAKIILAGMQIPPNLGHDYTLQFRRIYPSLAEEEGVHLIPFLLEGVGGVGRLMQNDGIHPTEEGHRVVAENVWRVLRPLLEEMREAES